MICQPGRLARLPAFTGNTPTYNDEGDSTTGWTLSVGALSQPTGSTVRFTQNTAGVAANMERSVTIPVADKDYILYAKVKAADGTGAKIIGLKGAGTERAMIYLHFNTVTGSASAGTLSIRHTTSGGTNTNAVGLSTIDATDFIDLALLYNSKNASQSLFSRQTNGTWKFECHVAASPFSTGTLFSLINQSGTPAWIEWDHLTLVSPNIQSIGDSITKGATLFSPIVSDALINGQSTWQQWAAIYPLVRNNLIVNKGVGSNTSALVAGRIQADALDNLPKVVFLGACNNDNGAGISLATRTSNIQSSIDAIIAAGAKVVLINAVYLTEDHASSPGSRAYSEQWWKEYRCTLTGARRDINVMEAVKESSGYQDPAYTQSDDIHPNVAGYTRYGQYIAGKRLS